MGKLHQEGVLYLEKQNSYIGNGIIGLFDILGYKSFLDNNDPSGETANEVIRILSSSIDEAKNEVHKILKANVGEDPEALRLVSETLEKDSHSFVVADTFVITIGYLDSAVILEKQVKWLLFIMLLQKFITKMFDYGLPVRGGVSFGKLRIENSIFIGKPIAEAYETAQELEIATGILSESAIQEINKIKDLEGATKDFEEVIIHRSLVKYLIPKKENKSKKHFAIPMNVDLFHDKNDIRQLVLECFWKHNKDIPLSAQPKVDNTEKFIRFLKARKNLRRNKK